MSNLEARIRELAHQIWESEGKPDGQHERHWQMACKLASADEKPATRQRTTRKITKPEPLQTEATEASAATSQRGNGATANGGARKPATSKPAARKTAKPLKPDGGNAIEDPSTKTLENPRVGTVPDKKGPGGKRG